MASTAGRQSIQAVPKDGDDGPSFLERSARSNEHPVFRQGVRCLRMRDPCKGYKTLKIKVLGQVLG